MLPNKVSMISPMPFGTLVCDISEAVEESAIVCGKMKLAITAATDANRVESR